MIIKVQDDNLNDRFLVEAAYIRWTQPERTHLVLEVYIVAEHSKKAGSIKVVTPSIEKHPSLRLKVYNGDRVFIMNDEGKTIDSKRISIVGAG